MVPRLLVVWTGRCRMTGLLYVWKQRTGTVSLPRMARIRGLQYGTLLNGVARFLVVRLWLLLMRLCVGIVCDGFMWTLGIGKHKLMSGLPSMGRKFLFSGRRIRLLVCMLRWTGIWWICPRIGLRLMMGVRLPNSTL